MAGVWVSVMAVLWTLLALEAELVCWQALLRCHEEPDCDMAYGQYRAACEGNLRGTRSHCPSHCVDALTRLNRTRAGPRLETCQCGADPECLRARRAIQPCLPRPHPAGEGVGCTEARRVCEEEPDCRSSLALYLSHCAQLFNGHRCSSRCSSTIRQLLLLPSGLLLDACECDGPERPFCQVVKSNMLALCDLDRPGDPSEHEVLDDVYEDEDYDGKLESKVAGTCSGSPAHPVPGVVKWAGIVLALGRGL